MEPELRVLRVIARLNVGGPAIHVAYLSAGLDRHGYRTTLVAGELAPGEASMADVAAGLGVEVVPLGGLSRRISPFRDLSALLGLVRLIRRERPDILHTHTAKAGALGRVAALLSGRRPRVVVHTFHGHVLRGYFGAFGNLAFRTLERLLAHASDALVVVSPEIRDELVGLGIAAPEKFAVVRLGLPLEERLADADVLRSATRLELGLPEERFVVGWVGRMTAIKRVDDVVAAFAGLRERGVDASLVLVGDGPDRRDAEELARRLGVADRCVFAGYRRDVAGFYAAFDVLLLPSANEGTPVTAIEALASGRPVVATRVGGLPDVVSEGEDGLLVPVGAVGELGERLHKLAVDVELRARMGAAGKRRALRRYSVERLVEDVDRLYRSLLSAAASRRR